MATRDLAHRIKSVPSIVVGAKTTTQTGSSVDTAQGSEYESVTFEIVNGAYTDSTIAWEFDDSSDGTNWSSALATPVISAAAPTYSTNAAQNTNALFGYYGGNRYVRAKATVSGATSGAVWGCNVILGHPHHHPAS